MVSRGYPGESSRACHRCFADKKLVDWIKAQDTKGCCDWCGAKNVYVVELQQLGDLFEPLVERYYPSDSSRGDFLSDLLQGDWEIFSQRTMDHGGAGDLVRAIMEAGVDAKELSCLGVDYGGLFHTRSPYHSTLEESWEESADEGPDIDPHEDGEDEASEITEMDRIAFAVEDRGISYASDSILYRARIYTVRDRKDLFKLEEMGAPPPAVTPAARANRAGHPVLYMASDMQTALAEVRAWKGAPVSVAKMKLSREYRILDLTTEYSIDSPFFVESLKWVIETNGLMNRFAEELSRPVMPHEAEILYRPTQNLCDLVKAAGCDGIAYPSAMGPGHNVVLFDPHGATPEEVSHHRVEKLSFTSRDLKPYELPHEDVPWSS